jgi:hypothetical protein
MLLDCENLIKEFIISKRRRTQEKENRISKPTSLKFAIT